MGLSLEFQPIYIDMDILSLKESRDENFFFPFFEPQDFVIR